MSHFPLMQYGFLFKFTKICWIITYWSVTIFEPHNKQMLYKRFNNRNNYQPVIFTPQYNHGTSGMKKDYSSPLKANNVAIPMLGIYK